MKRHRQHRTSVENSQSRKKHQAACSLTRNLSTYEVCVQQLFSFGRLTLRLCGSETTDWRRDLWLSWPPPRPGQGTRSLFLEIHTELTRDIFGLKVSFFYHLPKNLKINMNIHKFFKRIFVSYWKPFTQVCCSLCRLPRSTRNHRVDSGRVEQAGQGGHGQGGHGQGGHGQGGHRVDGGALLL